MAGKLKNYENKYNVMESQHAWRFCPGESCDEIGSPVMRRLTSTPILLTCSSTYNIELMALFHVAGKRTASVEA